MFLGYNTNGLAHHSLIAAIDLLADIGYQAVAITIDHHALSPFDSNWPGQLAEVARRLEKHAMRCVVETGARFILDPLHKHEPTLLASQARDRRRRIEFYRHALRCAAELRADCVSVWSGVAPPQEESRENLMAVLCDGLNEVLAEAERLGMVLAFEPEPGMFVATVADYDRLRLRLPHPLLRCTIDIGHLWCQDESPLVDVIAAHADQIANVHIEDMRRGRHEHLMFGEGEIDFPSVLSALDRAGYQAGVYVELSRHSHQGPIAARRAHDFLRRVWPQ